MPHKVLQRTYSTRLQRLRARVVADNYAPFYSPRIECTDRDAPFVLDGVLYHESDLDLEVGCLEQHGTAVGTGLLPVKGGHERLAAELRERNTLSLLPFSDPAQPPPVGFLRRLREAQSPHRGIKRICSGQYGVRVRWRREKGSAR